MLLLDGTPVDGHTVAELEQALRDAVARLREELIDDDELERVVTQAVAAKVYEADSLFYQAMEIGVLETVGLDWRLIKTEIERLKAVTPAQVREVARRYLTDDNLTVAVLNPLPMDDAVAERSASTGGRHGS
jgi:zinc protease